MIKMEREYRSTNELIEQFNEKHNIGLDNQFKQLIAEVGELSDALQREDEEAVKEELGDVEFVLRSISMLKGVKLENEVRKVTLENDKKDSSKEGSKVTKEGLE